MRLRLHISRIMDREHYLEAIKIIQKLKASEERNVELAKRILQKKIL